MNSEVPQGGFLDDLDMIEYFIPGMLDDGEKGRLLNDERHQQVPYDQRPGIVPDPHGSSSVRSTYSVPNDNINTEDANRDDRLTTSTSTAAPRRYPARDNQDVLSNYTPKIKARKYVLKPDEEKQNLTYMLKRAKNNDAVRKSRNKQKEMQVQRDKEMQDLRQENISLKKQLSLVHRLNDEQKQTIARMVRR